MASSVRISSTASNVVNLKIPTLAERTEDIPLLANYLLRQAADRHKPFAIDSTSITT